MHGRDFQFTENQRNEKYKNGFLPLQINKGNKSKTEQCKMFVGIRTSNRSADYCYSTEQSGITQPYKINTYLESRNSQRLIKILGEIVTIYIKHRASLVTQW